MMLYHQARTEEERALCFSSNILERIRIKNFNKVPGHEQLVQYYNLLNSLKGQAVLEGDKQQFIEEFFKKFLCLLEQFCIKGLTRKMEVGQNVFFTSDFRSIILQVQFSG